MKQQVQSLSGIALIDKPLHKSSFYLVSFLRKLTGVRCIGHAGTLDPFATGVMVLLIGKPFTRLSNQFIQEDKEYIARLKLGETTDTYDLEGSILNTSDLEPSLLQIENAIAKMQGAMSQTPPMFSAKKVNGKKLYELARAGKTIERAPKTIHIQTELLSYSYPYLDFKVTCSSGTYIRSIGHDIGQMLVVEATLCSYNALG